MDEKLFAHLFREKLRQNYDNLPFSEEEVPEDVRPEQEQDEEDNELDLQEELEHLAKS